MLSKKLRVFIYQSHSLVNVGLFDMFENANFEVVETTSLKAAIQKCRQLAKNPPDLFFLAYQEANQLLFTNLLRLIKQTAEFSECSIVLSAIKQSVQKAKTIHPRVVEKPLLQNAINEIAYKVKPIPRQSQEQVLREIRSLGSGASGSVKLVQNIKTRQLLALKIINFRTLTDRQKEKANQQIIFLKVLNCPNIIKYCYSEQKDECIYIYMEYAELGSLMERISDYYNWNKMFSPEEILDYLGQLTYAVKYMYKRNVIHRDIKPHNVFIDKHNLLKIGDFGISKQLNKQELAYTYIGTPYYMAPEIIQKKEYNSKADIWSLGCLFYEICYLKRPFDASTDYELYRIILNSQPSFEEKRYKSENVGIFRQLNELIKQMLQKDPAKRPTILQIYQHPLIRGAVMNHKMKLKKLKIDIKEEADDIEIDQINQLKNITVQALKQLKFKYVKQSFLGYSRPTISRQTLEDFIEKSGKMDIQFEKLIQMGFFQEMSKDVLVPFKLDPCRPFYYTEEDITSSVGFCLTMDKFQNMFVEALKNPQNLKAFNNFTFSELCKEERFFVLLNLWKLVKFYDEYLAKLQERNWLKKILNWIPYYKTDLPIIRIGFKAYTLESFQQLMLQDESVPKSIIFLFLLPCSCTEFTAQSNAMDLINQQAHTWVQNNFQFDEHEGQMRVNYNLSKYQSLIGRNQVVRMLCKFKNTGYFFEDIIKQLDQMLIRLVYV